MKKIFVVFFALACAIVSAFALLPVYGCSAKVEYKYNDKGYYEVAFSGFAHALGGELKIDAYRGEGESYAPVKEICADGFSGTQITSLSIPATVETIGARAFAYCSSLKEVVFEEGFSGSTLSTGAFAHCTALKKIDLPKSIKVVGAMSFTDCTSLAEVSLDGAEGIYAQAFEGCEALKTITFPEGLKVIGSQAFYYSGLESVVLPSTLCDDANEEGFALGYAAFHSCMNLKYAVIRGDVSEILSGTFGYCPNLEKVYLPSTVKEIRGVYSDGGKFVYGHAFHNCANLKEVHFAGTAEEWGEIKINQTPLTYNNSEYDNSALKTAEKFYLSEFQDKTE